MAFWKIPATAPDPSMCITGPDGTLLLDWDWRLVGVSVTVAIAGSFAALECAGRMRVAERRAVRRQLFVAGAALMGLAIWTMHFVGMLALQMPIPVRYDAGWSLISIAAAITGAGLAFAILMHRRLTAFHLIVGGTAMGLAIVSMHYIGMHSTDMEASIVHYEPWRFVFSIVIAIVASTGALWMSDRWTKAADSGLWLKAGSAVAMGAAIAGMHYMGMAAARYETKSVTESRRVEPNVGPFLLRDLVGVAGVAFVGALIALASRAAVERERAFADYRRLAAELEERVRDRTAELERLNAELTAFTDSVSHDLRGPLRSISGFADALLDTHVAKLDETGVHYLQRIRAGADRLDEQLIGLLNLSRVSRAELRKADVDLSDIARHVLADLAAQEPGRTVEWVVQPGLHAQADRALMISVLQNLLGNAWKFSTQRADARIEFGAARRVGALGRVEYFVRDNGAGFDRSRATKLFGMFERFHRGVDFAGHGVGLALVKRAIERHGGTIRAESEVGRGATFFFTLE